MKCPHCNETLLMTERHTVAIDYCPACRGVWLDQGELEKMIGYVERQYSTQGTQLPGDQSGHFDGKPPHHKPYRKKSFLGDLFDFD